MDYSNSDMHRYIMRRKRELRRMFSPNPNEETLNLWRLEDESDQFYLEMYEQEERAKEQQETPVINITSEVKKK